MTTEHTVVRSGKSKRKPLNSNVADLFSPTVLQGQARSFWAGLVIDLRAVRIGAGLFLIGWALYHWRYGHRHRVRVGMQAGLAALTAWSFLMATTHGAGLMLWPVLMPLCFPAASEPTVTSPFLAALLGVGIHTLAMLTVSMAVAVAVYEWIGLEILRHAWFNVDLIWTLALLMAGGLLLLG
jgi:hypothetical protein